MATLLIKGKPATDIAAAKHTAEVDDYALARWHAVALEAMEAMREYVRLRDRWTRMKLWLAKNPSHPQWRVRNRKCREQWELILAPGAMFDQIAKVIWRLDMAWRQLSETAIRQLVNDYGFDFHEADHPALTNLFIDHEINGISDFLNAWAVANGGHVNQGVIDPCPF